MTARRSSAALGKSLNCCARPQSRAFTKSSASKYGSGDLIDYKESSSDDLANLLQTIRSKIVIPHRLNRNQRSLIYRKEYATRLDNEPIYATVGGQRLRLQHIDKRKDIPAQWQVVKSVIELSKDKQDFDNLFHLLKEFTFAGVRMEPAWQAKLARKACMSNMLPALMTGLRSAKETGLSLSNAEVRLYTLWAIRFWAEDADWEEEHTRRALRYAEQVMAMLEDPLHGGGTVLRENDPRTDPTVAGFVLELVAVLAKRHNAGQDDSGKVAAYYERVISMFRNIGNEMAVSSEVQPDAGYISRWLPVWHGIETAQDVLKDQMPQPDAARKIAAAIKQVLTQVEGNVKEPIEHKGSGECTFTSRVTDSWRALSR